MSQLLLDSPTIPTPVRWTCELFHDTVDRGSFEGRNVFLVRGELLEMPPANPPHNSGLELVSEALRRAFGPGFWVRTQMALSMELDTDPVPDVAVIPGTPRTIQVQPKTAILVVEISDSTIRYDREEKSYLYAAGGIPEYWVLDVNNRSLIVFRQPIDDPTIEKYFHRYASVTVLPAGSSVRPVDLPQSTVLISDLLP